MYRKLLFVALITGLFACSDHDLPYYQSHLDEAENKLKECEAEAKDAFAAKDKEQLKALAEDLECKAAKQARSEYRRELAKLEMKKRLEQRQKKQEEEKQKFAEEYAQHKNEMADMDIESFYGIQKECGGLLTFKQSAKCKAFNELKKSKANAETNLLIEKYEGDKLTEFNKDKCKGINYNKVYCDLSRDAIKKQRQSQVDYYLANRESLKTVFNECQSKYSELKKSKKRDEARQYIKTFQCSTVSDAARKLKVYNFSKPIG